MTDEISPELRERIANYLADLDGGNDEARELLVEIADDLEIDFRRSDSTQTPMNVTDAFDTVLVSIITG